MIFHAFNRTAHKAMWKWIADNPHLGKCDWPGWNMFTKIEQQTAMFHDRCFACMTAEKIRESMNYVNERCHYCPLDFPVRPCFDDENDGLYFKYLMYQDMKEYDMAGEMALRISNLPTRCIYGVRLLIG